MARTAVATRSNSPPVAKRARVSLQSELHKANKDAERQEIDAEESNEVPLTAHFAPAALGLAV